MRVLLLEPDDARRDAAQGALERRGHDVVAFPSPEGAAGSVPADVVLVSTTLAAGDLPAGAPGPVVLLCGPGAPVAPSLLRARPADALLLDAGGALADDEVARLEAAVLLARHLADAARLAAACEASGAGVLLVSAEGRIERVNGSLTRLAGRPAEALVASALQDLIVPEGDDAERDAFDGAVRGGPAWTGEARLVASGGTAVPCRASVAPAGPGRGAVVTLLDLKSRVQAEASLLALNRMLEERSRLDPLSGLFNRAYLHEALDRELSRARRYHHPLAALMVDLDDFKRVNDAWGHDAGDEVLRAVAVALRAGFREGDVVARYGGDEFFAVLPSTDEAGAAQVAERVREHLKALRLGPAGAVSVHASVGIATVADLPSEAPSGELLRIADRAMLAAKRAGGDRVVAHSAMGSLVTPSHAGPASPRSRGTLAEGSDQEWPRAEFR